MQSDYWAVVARAMNGLSPGGALEVRSRSRQRGDSDGAMADYTTATALPGAPGACS